MHKPGIQIGDINPGTECYHILKINVCPDATSVKTMSISSMIDRTKNIEAQDGKMGANAILCIQHLKRYTHHAEVGSPLVEIISTQNPRISGSEDLEPIIDEILITGSIRRFKP